METARTIEKYSFASTKLANPDFWWSYWNKIDEVEIVGLCTDTSIISNAVSVRMGNNRVHIVVDVSCCAGTKPELHKTALDALKALNIEVINEGKEPWIK